MGTHPIGHTRPVTDARNYVKYTFLKVDPAWRRRTSEERAADKREFAAACSDFAEDHYPRAYSLVGTRGDCDLMVRTIATVARPDPRAPRAAQPERPDALRGDRPLLSRDDEGVAGLGPAGPAARPARRGGREAPDRLSDVEEARGYRLDRRRTDAGDARPHRGGAPFHRHRNTAYSFGLDDQEFVVAFDADDPADFLDLVQELRSTESAAYMSPRRRSSPACGYPSSGRSTHWTARS